MVIVDENGDISAGTSTNGASHKVPGWVIERLPYGLTLSSWFIYFLTLKFWRRVSDSALVGAGAYVDNDVGGAAATGDGDVMMRFVPW